MQYLGLAETVAVRRAGFCQRLPQRSFLRRYGLASNHPDVWPPAPHRNPTDLCRLLLAPAADVQLSGSSSSGCTGNTSEETAAARTATAPPAAGRFRHTRVGPALAALGPLALAEGVDFAIGQTKVPTN